MEKSGMNDDEIIMNLTEVFSGVITAYVSKEHRCRHKEIDLDPRLNGKWQGPVKYYIEDENG